MSTALEPAERAKLALASSDREKALIALAKRSEGITSITNSAGLDECHAARMRIARTRVEIQKIGKDAREDATKFSKAVIAEENRLIGFIQPEEDRLSKLETAYEAAIEAKRQQLREEEANRVKGIKTLIATMTAAPILSQGKSAEELRKIIEKLWNIEITELTFQEFTVEAINAKRDSLEALQAMFANQIAVEKEQARLADERRILAEEQAKQAEEKRKHDEAIAKELAEMKAKKEEQDRAIALAQKVLDEERQRLAKEEANRQAKIKTEKDRIERLALQAKLNMERDEREKLAAEKAERERPEMERLKTWVIQSHGTFPELHSERGQEYAKMFSGLFEKTLRELE